MATVSGIGASSYDSALVDQIRSEEKERFEEEQAENYRRVHEERVEVHIRRFLRGLFAIFILVGLSLAIPLPNFGFWFGLGLTVMYVCIQGRKVKFHQRLSRH